MIDNIAYLNPRTEAQARAGVPKQFRHFPGHPSGPVYVPDPLSEPVERHAQGNGFGLAARVFVGVGAFWIVAALVVFEVMK